MRPTRLHAEPFSHRLPARRKAAILLPLFALLLAGLACTRADVPPPGAIGSGSLPDPTQEPTQEPDLTQTLDPPQPTLPATPVPPSPTATPDRPEPVASPTFPATPTTAASEVSEIIVYDAQPGDNRRALAVRFGVLPEEITSPQRLPEEKAMIDPGQVLLIPSRLAGTGPSEKLVPDSELVFSPNAAEFDVIGFAAEQGGYLNRYREIVNGFWRTGPEVVERVALNNSINPRILLAILEFQSGWLTRATTPEGDAFTYPLDFIDRQHMGLYRQLTWLANELGNGYYGWRDGSLTDVRFPNYSSMRLAPDLNAGTVALQYYFSLSRNQLAWERVLAPEGFILTYQALFGDPWAYEYPLFEPGVEQPPLVLPFIPGHIWSFTGGPHGAWERESAWAALDFAPASSVTGCTVSEDWVVASAPGMVVRSDNGTVVIDLDGDGREQTGWSLLYLHVAKDDRVEEGAFVVAGDRLGHPSCEGGTATGTHIHLARKYNGEWILADGSLPFNLSGWVARAGSKPYQGALVKDGVEVLACTCASQETLIQR
jgi:LasA protease